MTKFDILRKSEVPDSQIKRSDFYSYKMVKISISRSVVYLISWTYMHIMHVFLGRFGWISLKKQRSAWKDQKMELNWRFEDVPCSKTESYGMANRKVWFSRIRVESEWIFSSY
jgi:hypothetical protein